MKHKKRKKTIFYLVLFVINLLFISKQYFSSRKDIKEANAHVHVGALMYFYGNYHDSVESYNQSLHLYESSLHREGIATSLIGLGSNYMELGDYNLASQHFQEGFKIAAKIKNRQLQAHALNNLGLLENGIGEYENAIPLFELSLKIKREINDSLGEMNSLNNLGGSYGGLGDYKKAIYFYEQSLLISRRIYSKHGESNALGNLAITYEKLEDYDKSFVLHTQSLSIDEFLFDKEGQGKTLSNIGKLFYKRNESILAIIFLKKAVSVYEEIRSEIEGLEPSLQDSFLSSIENNYRLLADLLLQQDRILEAQRVLDLLKVQELNDLFDNVRAAEDQEFSEDDYRDPEKNLLALHDQRIAQALDIGKKRLQLENIPVDQRTDSQSQQLIAIRKEESTFYASFDDFINSPPVQTIITDLQKHLDTNESFNLFEARSLRDNLQNLREISTNSAIFYPLILEDRLELVLVTADAAPVRKTVNISRGELNQLIAAARTTLLEKSTDYTALEKLHETLIAPLEPILAKAEIETLLYAPDGALRYIPLAALTDGNQWLIEKYRINNITALSLTDFDQPSSNKKLSVLTAAYTSGQHTIDLGYRQIPFNGLKFAGTEVTNIAQMISGTKSPRLDQNFTKDIVYEMNDYSVVHFATHAQFLPAKPKDSFIVFGNGEHSTIDDIKYWDTLTNVDLVVLSACDTGVGDDLGSGVEILGLGYRLQSIGARATMSSLWQVSDESTQVLMTEFYQQLQRGNISKVEALRQAQATMSQNPDYAHPYHWASFILIGNGL